MDRCTMKATTAPIAKAAIATRIIIRVISIVVMSFYYLVLRALWVNIYIQKIRFTATLSTDGGRTQAAGSRMRAAEPIWHPW